MLRDLRAFLAFWIMDRRDVATITKNAEAAIRLHKENTVRLVMRPGKTRLEFTTESGEVFAIVILKHVERTMHGTSALTSHPGFQKPDRRD